MTNYRKILGLVLLLCTLAAQAQGPKRYNLKVGDQFKVTATIKQDITQTMLGQEIETKQTITTVDLYEVVEASNNEYLFRTTGLSRSLYTETAGGSVSMDSDMEGDENLAFRVLTGKSYYVKMNQYGRFLEFQGMDAMGDAVRAELEGTTLEGSADDLLSSFDEETLGTAFDGQFYIYKEPGKPWSRSVAMKVNNLPISVDYEFERTAALEITAAGLMSMEGEFETMGQMMSAEMAGDQISTFKLDSKTGLSTNIVTIQQMDGSLEVSDISVPMTLKTRVEVVITK